MNNSIVEMDYAKDILSTYRQVSDPKAAKRGNDRLDLQQKNKVLESELRTLRDQYNLLRDELNSRDAHLAHLNHELHERTQCMMQLQEDFENVIFQFTQKKA